MYGLKKPSQYEDVNQYSYKLWFQSIYNYVLSRVKVVTTTAALTVMDDTYYVRVDCTGGALTITLPSALSYPGRRILIKKIDATGNAVTISRSGTDTIEGSNTMSLAAQWNKQELISNGNTMWEKL
jgi:hypothetical protein